VRADSDSAGALVAGWILDLLAATPPGRPFVIACPAGRTPQSTYAALGRLARERRADLSRVVIMMVDEYLDGAGRELCDPTAHYSCRRYLDDQLLGVVNGNLPSAHQLRRDRVHFPDPLEPERYEQHIADHGGIDVILLASGATDGHVAFNPPGSDIASVTRVVDLADSTRRDNLATFPDFGGIEDVPSRGVTIGLATILGARRAIMMLLGRGKSSALERLLACRRFDPDWPASVVVEHHDAWIVADRVAAESTTSAEA
jgi:glucosamine-6-phosphate deaminase